ncbi:MAG: CrcB family protein [Wenzhouxiangellaceae bacterium]|nr:CrcB family protein [Wenzhouxiangellaceae bacterium]
MKRPRFRIYLWIALAAMCGGGLRALIATLPLAVSVATLTANLLGALAIGLFWALCGPEGRFAFTAEHRLVVMTGFLGSLTTFSMAGVHSASGLLDGETIAALGHAMLTLLGALLAAGLGLSLGRLLGRRITKR